MNWRHGIHPNNYAIGETEKYYSDISRGIIVEKGGMDNGGTSAHD